MKQLERRLEGRFLCADAVRVLWVEEYRLRTLDAVLEDISPLGACIQLEEEIPVGANVVLTAGGTGLTGVITYCIYRDYGYFAGMNFSDETRWSSGMFVPDHMTDLQALLARTEG